MKTFYTSNYERNGTNPSAIAISNPADVPADYTGARDDSLSPTDELLVAYHDRKIGHDEYAASYLALLGERGYTPESVAEKFADGTIFICYDYEDGSASGDDADNGDLSICHRVFLSQWLDGVVSISEI